MKRRSFLMAAAGVAAGAWWLRPEDRGRGGHDDYFSKLGDALGREGLARPTMLVDLDRLDANIDATRRAIEPRAFRVVAKSLPAAGLLEYVMAKGETRRLMVFHQPFLNAVAAAHPNTELLLGKPMPAAAANRFFDRFEPGAFDPSRQIQWLIDSPERLRQYAEIADARQLALRVNVEIDVGLRRGGMADPADLAQMLAAIDSHPRLHFGGLMGYDAHAALPQTLNLRGREFEQVEARYRGFLEVWRRHAGGRGEEGLVLNAAGSPTYRMWDGVDGIANELAVGSGLVKPLNFDIDTLSEHVPALFIATPVLKVKEGLEIPAIDIGPLHQLWDPNRARTFFVYGGYWKAEPVSPPGLATHPVYGRSTNQEMLNGSERVELAVDDTVFFRPTQSEFVMLQFGPIAAVRGGRVVDFWEPLPQGA
ncbi:MAG: DSD1 family PLP-dependent enzyme [Myxococcales bacterium]|nr:DSD1 family PLP-dependent enzyme [Myxococcales bacterium]